MSMTFARLELTDGSTSIDLLRGGVYSKDYRPGIPQLKDGGIWQDNALATGRKLVDRRFGNVIDTFDMAISGPNQNDTIAKCGDLLRLLEKARDFSTSSWQSESVWIKRQAGCESHPTYALVFDYSLPELSNPFASPFAAATDLATLDGFDLGIEHSIWLSEPPGQSTCVQVSAWQTGEINGEWTLLASPVGANSINALLQSTTGRIFGADQGRIIYSDDDGATWAVSTALPVGQVDCLLQTTTGRILAGEDGGVWRTDNDGVAWAFSVEAFTEVHALIQLTSGRILAADDNGAASQIWKSDDNGATWQVLVATPSAVTAFIQTNTGRILATRTGYIQASDDNGATWTVIAYNLDVTAIFRSMGKTSTGRILGDAYNGVTYSIRRSDDDGVTWTIVCPDTGTLAYGILQLTTGRILMVGGNKYKSDDNGNTWSAVEIGSYGFLSLIETTTGHVLAGADGKIFSYGPVTSMTMGATASCNGEQFVANKGNTANLTHVFVADAGVFGVNLLPCVFPVTLLPPVPEAFDANNDSIYFGNAAGYPFESLVFDIDHPITFSVGIDIAWEYYTTGHVWTPLTVTDGTNPVGAGVFLNTGVVSVHWVPPANWDTVCVVNGVTGIWVRARVTDLHGGTATAPTQQNRNIYTVTWPDVDITAAQVAGDMPALARIKLRNRSDQDGSNAPTLWDNRIVIGLRSYSRGASFTAYLNAASVQTIPGIVAAGATGNTTFPNGISGITGQLCTYAAQAADTVFADQITFTLQPTVARDFYGTFHAFLRARVTAGSSSDIHARLQVRTGSGGVSLNTADDYLKSTTDYEVLDLGRVSIPASGVLASTDLGDTTVLAVQFRNDAGVGRTVYIHDLVLIPVDEWATDVVDHANTADSIIGFQDNTPHLLDIDSIALQKVDIRTPVRTADANGYVTSIYVPGMGPTILQANAHQRLWVFAMNTSATGTSYTWLAEPWVCHSVQVWCNSRWLGLRGDR